VTYYTPFDMPEVVHASREALAAPPRPGRREEVWAARLFFSLGPRFPRVEVPAPGPELAPFESFRMARRNGPGDLGATWYPAGGSARGAVLFLHPWLGWGQAYFHRRGRIEAVRAAGYHALTIDLPGFGSSGPRNGFIDRDVDDALAGLREREPALPHYLWGVSSGGYWAHPALARRPGVRAAVFEDVSPHLLEWSWLTAPWGRPAYLFFRLAFRRAYRYLDLRLHARHLGIPTAHVSGALDRGIPAAETRRLAELSGGAALVVPEAGHLSAIRFAGSAVCELALATFERG